MEKLELTKGFTVIELEERHEMAAAPGLQVAPNYPGGLPNSDPADLQACCVNRCHSNRDSFRWR